MRPRDREMKQCAQEHRGCLGLHSNLLWIHGEFNMESWRSVPLKMRTSSTVTMWEDAESQCIEPRPHGQKTEQKKVNFFTTYSVVIRNMKMSQYKMCNTANNNIVGKKVHQLIELQGLDCGCLVGLKQYLVFNGNIEFKVECIVIPVFMARQTKKTGKKFSLRSCS